MPRNTSGHRKPHNKKLKFTEPVPTVSTVPVSLSLATKLRELDRALFAEFGFGLDQQVSYAIQGGGGLLAASNVRDGVVVPAVKHEPPEGRVYSENDLWQQPSGTVVVHPVHGSGVIQRAGRVASTDEDDRVVKFEGGETFVLPAPATVANTPPWNAVVKVIRKPDCEISTALSSKV
ncbi:MAG: hypothetical protein K8U57_40240 [Planctomycetes bacterium]|nr:hypothetical protein [Planctomycetota bacterium]